MKLTIALCALLIVTQIQIGLALNLFGTRSERSLSPRPECGEGFTFLVRKPFFGYRVIHSDKWMSNMKSSLADKKYSVIKIPATHDSGTYNINDHMSYSIDTMYDPGMLIIPQLNYVFGAYGINQTLIKSFIAPWMHNQQCNVASQLLHGIRHFDFRVCVVPGEVGYSKF